jgi:hypothetical protein
LENRDVGTAGSIIGRALGRLSVDISGDVEALERGMQVRLPRTAHR